MGNADDSKVASTKIKIGARLDIKELVSAAIEYTRSHTTIQHTDPERATAGDHGAATSRYLSESGRYGLSVARGNNCRVRGEIGAILVIAEESPHDFKIKDWKAVVVDGKKVKPDTYGAICESGERSAGTG